MRKRVHYLIRTRMQLGLTLGRFLQGEDVEEVQLRKEGDLKGLTQKINDLIRLTKDLRGKK